MNVEQKSFIPDSFTPKERVETIDFVLRKLTAKDVDMDYEAVMSSIAIIHQIRGGSWPDSTLTHEDDLIDLCWHQREFEFGTSFAYTLTNLEGTKCLGCLYIYPTSKPWITAPEGTDAVVNMWVTQQAYDQGLYPKLFHFVQAWIAQEGPFQHVFYSNIEKPE